MSRRLLVIVLLTVIAIGFAAPALAQEPLPPDLSLKDVAHAKDVRGGDLAEALGLPRGIDKETPLTALGVDRQQLQQALGKLGVAAPGGPIAPGASFTPANTIREIATALDINGKTLAHDVGLDVAVDKDTPLAALGVDQETLDKAIAHNLSHEESPWDVFKYPIYALISLLAVGWLVWWGVGRDPKKRREYYPQKVYIGALVFAVIVLGFALGKSPNPMEGAVKLFKATVGLYDTIVPKLLLMGFFLALAAVGNKVICGWACPFGALQELLYMLPWAKKIKQRELPFWVTNTVRAVLFVLFLLGLYGVIAPKGFVLYHYVNPFNLFNFDFSTRSVLWAVLAYAVIGLFFYRPFCRIICPFGFLSWLVERISLSRVRIDFDRCIDCNACARACPLTAAADRLAKKPLPADCFACQRCLRVCPTDAIHFRQAWGEPSPPPAAKPEP